MSAPQDHFRSRWLLLACVVAASVWTAGWVPPAFAEAPHPSTFSIVAADPATGEVGVAVASRFFAVGSVVPYARAGVGAVATQASANTTWGPGALELLARGVTPTEALAILTRADDGQSHRQAGVVAADGRSATFTGPECSAWAGGRSGQGYAVQGNILTGEPVVAAMEKAFLAGAGRPLAERLYAAIVAGDAAGGDSRGKQSAVLLVSRPAAATAARTTGRSTSASTTMPSRSSSSGDWSTWLWSPTCGTAAGRPSATAGAART